MVSKTETATQSRWIPVARAADLIGKRFHSDWISVDTEMLEFAREVAADQEAWERAKHVQDLLHSYIVGGRVTAYAPTDDGASITDMPVHWVTAPFFAVCIRTGTCRLDFDHWEKLWLDEPELRSAIPDIGKPREKHTYEWDKIIHEAWMFTLQQDDLPTNAEVVRHLGDWCPANGLKIPDGSHLSKVAKTVLDFLKEDKPARQNLK